MSTSRSCFRFGLLFLAVFVISVIAAPDEGVASPAQVETNDIQEAPAVQRLARSAPVTTHKGKKADGTAGKKKAVKKAPVGKAKLVGVIKKEGGTAKPVKKAVKPKTVDGKTVAPKKKVQSKDAKTKNKAVLGKKLKDVKKEGATNTIGVIG